MAKNEKSAADSPQPEDPAVNVSSIPPKVGEPEAQAVGTAQAVVETGRDPEPARPKDQRTETYPATAPDGSTVMVEHNIDTGETKVK